VERTRIVLEEKRLEYDLAFIDLSKKPKWFLDISPRGKVPVLLVDGHAVFESTAINELLEDLFPENALLPQDPLQRAEARSWIVFNNEVIMSALSAIIFNPEDEPRLTAEKENLRDAFQLLEKKLSQRKSGEYFLGEKFSLVDVVFAPVFTRWEFMQKLGPDEGLKETPLLKRYRDTLLSRQSVQNSRVQNLA
jgi:glutathione S-transferase